MRNAEVKPSSGGAPSDGSAQLTLRSAASPRSLAGPPAVWRDDEPTLDFTGGLESHIDNGLADHPRLAGCIFDGNRNPGEDHRGSWMTKFAGTGEDVSFVLETELGRQEIRGETAYALYLSEGDEFPTEGFWPLYWQQAGVKFSRDGEGRRNDGAPLEARGRDRLRRRLAPARRTSAAPAWPCASVLYRGRKLRESLCRRRPRPGASDQADLAPDRGLGGADERAAAPGLVCESSRQQGGTGSGQHQGHDRLAGSCLDRDLGNDACRGEGVLEQLSGRGPGWRHDQGHRAQLGRAERSLGELAPRR